MRSKSIMKDHSTSEVSNRIIEGRKIRVALVGCGRISAKHLEAIQACTRDLELVGVSDSDPFVLGSTADRLKVPAYRSLEKVLEKTDADVVVLATPSGLHADQTVKVAKAGRHIVTEKPMATRWQDGLRMVQACDAAGVQLHVVKQNRHNPTLQLLKRAVEKKRFGRIYLATINVFWSRPQEYYDSSKWRGTWEFDGGALMNQASHYVDLLDWLIGPVQSVQAYTATLARNIEVEDTAVVNLRWRSGALGSANVTMLTYKKNLEGSITVLGEKGTVRLGGVAVNKFEHWEFETPDEDDEKVKSADYQTSSVYGFGHSHVYENVIRSLRGTAHPMTDGREGLRSLEVLIASYISARDGRSVSLPLEY